MSLVLVNSTIQTILILAIVILLIFVCIFEFDMGEYLRNMLDYLNNNENSVVFQHLDKFIELIEITFVKIYTLFKKLKGYFIKHE